MIKRKYFKELENEFNFEEISVLIGSRRVGKTTIMEYLFEKVRDKAVFLSFDSIDVLNLFENNEKLFKEQYVDSHEIIFIDEIQYAKNSGRILKYLFDSTKKKFVVSGSSTPEISLNSLSYLVGRVRIINIFPLNFIEFVTFKNSEKKILFSKLRKLKDVLQLKDNFEQYIKYGGYPRIATLPLMEKEKALNDLVDTYLLKEIKDILEYKNIFEFKNFLKHLALIDGNLINKSSISMDLGINTKKITEMIDVLEKTFILYIVRPFLKSKVKEQIKTSKIYFQDLGFKNSLINNFNELNLRQDQGNILENFVLSLFVRKGHEIKFWNYKNRYEMDFVIEQGGKIIGFECKSKLKTAKFSTSTREFIKRTGPDKVFIVNKDLDSKMDFEGIKVEFINYFSLVSLIENDLIFL